MNPPDASTDTSADASTDASTNACAYAGTTNSVPNLRNYLACGQEILRFSAEVGLKNAS